VPAIVWMVKHFDYKKKQLMPYKDHALSHDDLFCTLLVAFEINTKMCAAKEEMLMKNQTFSANALP
jgi:lipid A ethanolaminephosphotransferase